MLIALRPAACSKHGSEFFACGQGLVVDVGGKLPSNKDASYVIGLGLMQALAHAAPDVPPSKYPELGARYRFHYSRHQDDISLFHGVLPLLAD